MRILNDINPIVYGEDGKVKEVLPNIWVQGAPPVIFFPIPCPISVAFVSEEDSLPERSPRSAVAIFRAVSKSGQGSGWVRYHHTEYTDTEGFPYCLPTINEELCDLMGNFYDPS